MGENLEVMVGRSVDTVFEMYKLVSIQIEMKLSLNILSVRRDLKRRDTVLCPNLVDHKCFQQGRRELTPETVRQSLWETY